VRLTKLFEPITIGSMTVKNRIAMAPVAMRYNTPSGTVTHRVVDHYVERAKGGVGLIIVEATTVDWPVGKVGACPLRLDGNQYIHAFRDLVEEAHAYGAKMAIQLQHVGGQTNRRNAEGEQPVAPSVVPFPRGDTPRALTIPEIHHIVEEFADSILRAKTAGFDAVEIHGSHGYLVTQFHSPYFNKRTDMYGGSFENRMRFTLEIIEAARGKVGPGFPIIFRFSADEHVAGGVDLAEAKRIAKRVEEAGVDAIDLSAGVHAARPHIFPPMAMPRGCNVHLAEGIKSVVDLPVIVVGRLGDPALAEQVLADGKADMIALGRPLLADPYLPQKAEEGRVEDICPCISCNACIDRLVHGWSVGCAVNPALGRERDYTLEPAEKAKKVLVVGGGPAGMEAARVAALRGHEVTLYEKANELGGQLLLASVPSFKKDLEDLLAYLRSQLEKSGVRVELGREVSEVVVREEQPDVVIVATGAEPTKPSIPGIDGKNVTTAEAVLRGEADPGRLVVVAGGGRLGLEMAYFLAQRDREVTVVEMQDEVGVDMEMCEKTHLLEKLDEHEVSILAGHNLSAVTEDGVELVDRSWNARSLGCNAVVLALGSTPRSSLSEQLARSEAEVYTIGDCKQPRRIYEAIHEAWWVARQIGSGGEY
jgi:2,4-dienoyl-CoA reductase-like NADH-dependent reductase (Old Yellow Enzyme family)/thioredoxin reductase